MIPVLYATYNTIVFPRTRKEERKTHFLEDDDAFPPAATEALLRRFFPAILYLQQHTQTLAMRMEEWNSLVDNVFSLVVESKSQLFFIVMIVGPFSFSF